MQGEASFNTMHDIMHKIKRQSGKIRALGLTEDLNDTIRLIEDVTRVLSLINNPESEKIHHR